MKKSNITLKNIKKSSRKFITGLYPCLSKLNAFSFTSEIGKLRKTYLIFSFREKLNGLYFEELLLKKTEQKRFLPL